MKAWIVVVVDWEFDYLKVTEVRGFKTISEAMKAYYDIPNAEYPREVEIE